MRFTVLASVTTIGGILIACSSESTPNNTNTGDGGTTSSSSGGSSSGATSSSGGSSSGGTTKPPASTTDAPVTIDAACPAFTACGGTLEGTWDYQKGCVGDQFKTVRGACPELDTTGLKVTVKGSIYFLGGGALERNVTSAVTGVIKFPESCASTLNQTCDDVEAFFKNDFPNIDCSKVGTECNCTASRSDTNTAATTYTVTGNTVKTADGDEYDFCVNGSTLTYSGKTKEAEEGVFELKKR